jgi:predicted acyl esterase
VLATAAALAATGTATAASSQEVTIASADGTTLAATLHLPDGTPPAGGWPAVVLMHGLGGNRSSMNTLAGQMGLIGNDYAVLTFDARGHGESKGLIGIDGPAETADVRAVFAWLRDRPDVSDMRIGAFGVSLGGGAAWNSLVAGVPWAAIATCITWTNLQTALMPQGLAKSGVVGGFISSLDQLRVDPSVVATRDAAFAGNLAAVAPWAATRSSASMLGGVTTPVFVIQGRRDFAFGLDQAFLPWSRLKGPKRLWIGNMGHAPSIFAAPDTPAMLAESKRWFDRFLRGMQNGADTSAPITIASEGSARTTSYKALPPTRTLVETTAATDSVAASGKVVRPFKPAAAPLEVFGSPIVKVEATAAGGWPRLVAVLTATTPKGEIVVAGGGVPTRPGKRTYAIQLASQATVIPKGAKLAVTIASSSQTQRSTIPLYLDLPVPAGASVTVGRVTLRLPTLQTPVRT